jgi:hypothetical protein
MAVVAVLFLFDRFAANVCNAAIDPLYWALPLEKFDFPLENVYRITDEAFHLPKGQTLTLYLFNSNKTISFFGHSFTKNTCLTI